MDWRERLAAYAVGQLHGADRIEVANVRGMPAGASNDTVSLDLRVSCDGFTFDVPLVLRPERPDGILAPYDVEQQYRVMRALACSPVPVPAVLWYEPDASVIGAPFFLMERVSGETLPLFWYAPSVRLRAAARQLAAIHSIDWRAAGLEFLLPTAAVSSPLESALGAWRLRAERLRISRAPLLITLGEWLKANEPADARMALLHGDPNPGNYLFQGDQVAAVVDWEVAAIGDPRSDLGFYSALHTVFGGVPGPDGRTLLSDAYQEETGVLLRDLEFYEATGLYRMAVVMAGWAGRFTGMASGYTMDAIARRLSVLLGPRWNF